MTNYCIAPMPHDSSKQCGKEIIRREYVNGRKESQKQFDNRHLCDSVCAARYRIQQENINFVEDKNCEVCGKKIRRRLNKKGKLEAKFDYSRRKSCCDSHEKILRKRRSKEAREQKAIKKITVELTPVEALEHKFLYQIAS